ncbi:MAG: hypothetical protein HYX76_14595 [Acidobacteria bacterium]|nr:hypothetical protein [Acidobacteriota bacterium]
MERPDARLDTAAPAAEGRVIEAVGAPVDEAGRHYLRFDAFHRLLHGLLMLAFLGLAATGLPLLFSDEGWAARLARGFGGFAVAHLLHRVFASLLIAVFATHVGHVLHRVFVRKDLGVLWGPSSMVPQPRDFMELVRHFRWFVGLGPRPRFDHFTYWEKFDYWAVFWGMGIIGGSGLVLWFPVLFAKFLPGWLFNIALLIHGEEALLAVGFIFTIHFFNTHLRPEKFPVDRVIFTGRLTEQELREERLDEFDRLAREGRLAEFRTGPPTPALLATSSMVAAIAVPIGLFLVSMILYALLS